MATMPSNILAVSALEVKQLQRSFYLTKMTVADLVTVAYAAPRGSSADDGLVQRLLNKKRIQSLAAFARTIGDYPASIVLNWSSAAPALHFTDGMLHLELAPRSAQIIDGQHRVEGLRVALASDPDLGRLEVPISIYESLELKGCADIFLAINTEQKPVPKSLVFDLYGIASEQMVDPAAVRAKDIASFLNENADSPYFEEIKFPGSPKRRGGIALSTAVAALKPLVALKGTLDQLGLSVLEQQSNAILNFFDSLRDLYGDAWDERSNPFLYASGFAGALDFFRTKLAEYCWRKKSFSKSTITASLRPLREGLLSQDELKGLSGSTAQEKVSEHLIEVFTIESQEPELIEF